MNRYDFVYVFDVKDANPNGDPDAGNLPRVDPETGHGLVTDVCIKRKVRNYVALTRGNANGHRIYFSEGAVLNRLHQEAYESIGEKPKAKKLPKDVEKARKVTEFMCRNFWDIRTFGAVMTTEVNCGQVRGPVQISFARSTAPIVTLEHAITRSSVTKAPIVTLEHAITRSSVTNEPDLEKERTMGRKFTVPYAVYVAHGFVNSFLAKQTGFSEGDLDLFWESLVNAFQFDQSAARPAGSMACRRLIVFRHPNQLGAAPSHTLLEAVTVRQRGDVEIPRSFDDYQLSIERSSIPETIEVIELP